tara:strand:- start:284 stop:505 length:222 start_codon:yes stop_codon:yes gene_type:complete
MEKEKIEVSTQAIDTLQLQKMVFIFNAIEKGWSVKKKDDKYIFTKNHENKREVFLESYLRKFITENISIDNVD